MTETDILAILTGYHTAKGRIAHLPIEIAELEKELETLKDEILDGLTGPKAQQLDGMPKGKRKSDPTGKLGQALADGTLGTGETKRLEERIASKRQMLETAERDCRYCESWLDGLMDRERLVISMQTVDGRTWRETAEAYAAQFGDMMSEATLRRIRERAIQLICMMAGAET